MPKTKRVYRARAYYEDVLLDTERHFLTKKARDAWAWRRRRGYEAEMGDPLFGDGRDAIPPAIRVEVAMSDPVSFPNDILSP